MIFFYGLVGVVVAFDQLTKFCILKYLPEHSVSIIPNILHLTLVKNTGVAFGLLSEQTALLFTVITVSLGILFVLANRFHGAGRAERLALSLILGGAIGNWIDRLRIGAVIDFIDFRVWPVFNLADSAITIGVGIYLLHMVISGKKS